MGLKFMPSASYVQFFLSFIFAIFYPLSKWVYKVLKGKKLKS